MFITIIEISFIFVPTFGALYLIIQGIRKRKIYLILFPLMFFIVLCFSVLLIVDIF